MNFICRSILFLNLMIRRIALVAVMALFLVPVNSFSQNGGYYSNFNRNSDAPRVAGMSHWSFVIGYVNKSWICTYPSGTQREDFFGDTEDKFLHGIQFGGLFNPSFDWGLGLRTGLFLEVYESKSSWIIRWCDRFAELDLYIPLHASYKIPLNQDFSLNLYGGIGFQWALTGRYEIDRGSKWTSTGYRPRTEIVETQEYGNGWPQKTNWQGELGMTFRYKALEIGFIYSYGLVDHGIQHTFDDGETYITASKSRQDKMQAFVAIMF